MKMAPHVKTLKNNGSQWLSNNKNRMEYPLTDLIYLYYHNYKEL